MSKQYAEEVGAYLQRAEQSIEAARQLYAAGFHDFCASRAYYAAFYAATALLLSEGLDYGKHSAVISSIHQRFVKSGRLSREQGKRLNWLFELRSIGDYGGTAHVSGEQAKEAIEAALEFVRAVQEIIHSTPHRE
ncbi:MAG: HEPN domain-containing protein [Armatimonadota bacterium]|nr:HEPN domain-containing protein [Armatimonadota bacterium]